MFVAGFFSSKKKSVQTAVPEHGRPPRVLFLKKRRRHDDARPLVVSSTALGSKLPTRFPLLLRGPGLSFFVCTSRPLSPSVFSKTHGGCRVLIVTFGKSFRGWVRKPLIVLLRGPGLSFFVCNILYWKSYDSIVWNKSGKLPKMGVRRALRTRRTPFFWNFPAGLCFPYSICIVLKELLLLFLFLFCFFAENAK